MRFPFRLRSILRLLLNAVTLLLLLLAVAAVVFGVRSHRVGEEWEILGGEVRGDLALHRSTCFYSFEGVVHVIKVERDEPRKWGEQALAASPRRCANRRRAIAAWTGTRDRSATGCGSCLRRTVATPPTSGRC